MNTKKFAAVSYGEGRAFFSTHPPHFPYKGRLIGSTVHFEAVAYGEERTFSGGYGIRPYSVKWRYRVAISFGERRTFSGDHIGIAPTGLVGRCTLDISTVGE